MLIKDDYVQFTVEVMRYWVNYTHLWSVAGGMISHTHTGVYISSVCVLGGWKPACSEPLQDAELLNCVARGRLSQAGLVVCFATDTKALHLWLQ